MTTDLITRDWLHPALCIHGSKPDSDVKFTINHKQFCEMIDYWKVMLIEKHNIQEGQTCLLCFYDPNPYYYSAIFAVLELGMTLIIDIPHVYCHDDLSNPKITMHGIIDLAIIQDSTQNAAKFGMWDMIMYYRQCRNIVREQDFDTYIIQQPELFEQRRTLIQATADTVLVQSPSSGTTGLPKTNKFTHRTVYRMCRRNMQYVDFPSDGRSLHIRNLHHGISLTQHFLPSFALCQHQYTHTTMLDTPESVDDLCRFVINNSITNIQLFTADILLDWAKQTSKLPHKIFVTSLFHLPTELIYLAREKNIAVMTTHFGATNIGQLIFECRITPDTDPDTYEVNNFGQLLDDFWQVEIRDERLWVRSDALEQEWRTSDDRFTINNSNYYFHGRINTYRINDTWIDLEEINRLAAEHIGNSGTLCLDPDHQKIYLMMWDESDADPLSVALKNLYPNLRIDLVVHGQKRTKFFNSRKIDQTFIRQFCRRQISESVSNQEN